MKRKLLLAMLLSLSATSPLALALGLEEAEVNSTLNAPLRASIPLTDSSGLQAELLNVSVADEQAFSSAGLSRTPLAASVKMEVTRRQGRLVVDLSTQRPVNEPWLDLLLRLEWPGGQQLQEVTLLLDPPDYDQLPALVEASSIAPRSSVAPPRSNAPARQSSSRLQARTSRADAGDPAWISSGDTLMTVARRLRPDSGISMSQMMVALVEANPEVFPSGNINAMRAGFTLVVPPRQAITSRSEAEADRLVQAMNQAWANRGSGSPAPVAVARAPSPQGASAALAETGQPKAASREASQSGDDTASEGGQRLTLLSDAELAAEVAAPGDGVSNPQEGGQSAQSTLSFQRDAPPPLAMPDGSEGAGPVIAPGVLGMIHGSAELTEAQRLQRLESRWRENRQALEAVRRERDVLQAQLANLRDELQAMGDQLAVLTADRQGVDAAGGGSEVAPDSTADSLQQAPWWGTLVPGEGSRSLLLGGAGLALLLALWAVLRHRRRDDSDSTRDFNEAQPVETPDDGLEAPGDQTAAQKDAQRIDSQAPVYASMPETEAINEADIFIAYRRYDQARELLDASLEREPGRDDLRLKLLRVLLEQGDHASAAHQAKQLRDTADPQISAEVEQLLEGHALSAAPDEPRAESPADRAIFPAADEHPPRLFEAAGVNEALDTHESGECKEITSSACSKTPSRDMSSDDTRDKALRSSKGPSQGDSAAERSELAACYRSPEQGPQSHGAKGTDELPQPPLTARQMQDGSRFIDYQPPTLEKRPAPREETPMQPSVEFTSATGGGGESAAAKPAIRAERDDLEQWDVEEVAFPPLSRDNTHYFAAPSSSSTLAEARRLLDAGEAGQARVLLESLIDESDDPDARQEARELLDQSVQ
ncbi:MULTISPECIES: FimV/HubP family polar landmark protein [Halomonas]|nr:FimV/HubP family polar landmark protein [Halomonas ventosae]